jgi:2-dehydro-3-deoxyphosphogluconate aldolase / (4S)-4-hydroxy-2-oxoglutarate aldolase
VKSVCDELIEAGIIAIIRGDFAHVMDALVDALLAGGVRALEVTMNSPGALESIAAAVRQGGDGVLVGAGTVLEVPQVKQVAQTGARFIVSPDTFPDVIEAALDYRLEPIPGALTPSEVRMAVRAGARLVKLFPATLGGPAYLRDIRAPLDTVAFVPTGGITPQNAGGYFAAGAAALGVGSALVPGDFDGSPAAIEMVTQRARQFVEAAARR